MLPLKAIAFSKNAMCMLEKKTIRKTLDVRRQDKNVSQTEYKTRMHEEQTSNKTACDCPTSRH